MDIRARILARADLNDLRALRDLDSLATKLNEEGLTAICSRFVTARVVRTLPNGKDILSALKSHRQVDDDIELAYTFLMQGAGIDIGDATVFALIDELVAMKIFEASWAVQLKSLALQPIIVTREQVRDAMYSDDGSEK